MSQELIVAVSAHKPYWMPADPIYQPVWVGAALRDDPAPAGWVRDDSYVGNISDKNTSYCELTMLHWLWKATQSEYVGLAHYRRYFARGRFGAKQNRVAHGEDLLARLAEAPLVLPKPRRYFVETNQSQYAHAHHAKDLDSVREVLAETNAEVVPFWDASMKRTYGHRFNMFVAHREVLDAWCSFLFPVLTELEERIDVTGYSSYDARVFGFLSERMLDAWVEASAIPYVEMPVVNMESQHWPRKVATFLSRKLK